MSDEPSGALRRTLNLARPDEVYNAIVDAHKGLDDAACRAFDARARGTVLGDGVALVVLKRLEDALTDGDTVHAVIRGFAPTTSSTHGAMSNAAGSDSSARPSVRRRAWPSP